MAHYAVTTAYLKNCILRNFAFFNFSGNLGFPSLEEGCVNLQILLISVTIITISKFHKILGVRVIFRKICILRNFAFYNFLESSFSASSKGFGNFTATSNITWNHYNIKVSKKKVQQGLFSENFGSCEILRFTTFSRILVFSPSLGNISPPFNIP